MNKKGSNILEARKLRKHSTQEIASMGGIAKREKASKRATLRILAQEFGKSKIKNQRIIAMLKDFGIDPKDAVQDMLLILQCFQGIAKGNPKWADIYLRIRQEAQPEMLEIKREEVKIRKAELKLKQQLAEKQMGDGEEDGNKPIVQIYLPKKEDIQKLADKKEE